MPRFFRQTGLTRTLLAAFAALWFMAALTPCAMAASEPCHGDPCPACPADGAAPQHPVMLMADCQTPDQSLTGIAPALDTGAAPVLLQRLPALDALSDHHHWMPAHRHAALVPRPPLSLQPAKLLI
ncbi:MAG: hypothetical protein A2150_04450 [Candidatus Muproteobacteria bacterium RBG_16_64_11]|uniref:Uncharacterized protein n=1 Tax=Candidatus Muproteobacteria bacterium RBG_16_64_11 TaxID=1817758 RepID=A0A1F6TE69_9PROT|nr:MAG: hypothetical protein A2150_04450 [Candidatus Muproteobacteria bacterium RBG_16_64_11]